MKKKKKKRCYWIINLRYYLFKKDNELNLRIV